MTEARAKKILARAEGEAHGTWPEPTPMLPAIDLEKVLATLNSMPTDRLEQLFHKLAIIHLVDDANRWRHAEERYPLVKRVLASAGIEV